MDGKVIFCKDGILRFQSNYDDSVSVPMVSMQEVLQMPAHRWFIQHLRTGAILEKGSTLASFLLCLEPWAETVNDLTDRRVDLYIQEVRKPSAETPIFDRIECRRVYDFRRAMVHDPIPEGVDWLEWLNRDREAKWHDDKFTADTTMQISGYKDGEEENWSTSASIHKIKNVPLVINRTPLLVEIQNSNVPQKHLMNINAPGVRNIKGGIFAVDVEEMDYLSVNDLLDVVISQGLWFSTPMGAIREAEMLKGMMDEVNALEEDASEDAEPALKLVTDEVEEEEEEEQDEDGQKKMTIKVMPGAFSGIATHISEEKEEWNMLMECVRKLPQPLRIGKLEEDTPKDNRIFGVIIPE